jgi:hypothetical protein
MSYVACADRLHSSASSELQRTAACCRASHFAGCGRCRDVERRVRELIHQCCSRLCAARITFSLHRPPAFALCLIRGHLAAIAQDACVQAPFPRMGVRKPFVLRLCTVVWSMFCKAATEHSPLPLPSSTKHAVAANDIVRVLILSLQSHDRML